MSYGNPATLPGFILSVLFIADMVILPYLSKGNRSFINLLLCFFALISIASILWMLKSADVINSDLVIPIIVVFLTPFYGLTYAVTSLKIVYSIVLIFALLGTGILFFSKKKRGKL